MLFLRLKENMCQGPHTEGREDNKNATYGSFLQPQYDTTDRDWRSRKAQASELDQRFQPTPFSCVLTPFIILPRAAIVSVL